MQFPLQSTQTHTHHAIDDAIEQAQIFANVFGLGAKGVEHLLPAAEFIRVGWVFELGLFIELDADPLHDADRDAVRPHGNRQRLEHRRVRGLRQVDIGNVLIAGQATGYELGANLLNFGALLAFMGVNAAAFVRYYLHEKDKKLMNLLPPVLGFVICALLWLNLSTKALIFGSIWMAIGIAFGAWKTKGFRGELVNFDLPPEDAEG